MSKLVQLGKKISNKVKEHPLVLLTAALVTVLFMFMCDKC